VSAKNIDLGSCIGRLGDDIRFVRDAFGVRRIFMQRPLLKKLASPISSYLRKYQHSAIMAKAQPDRIDSIHESTAYGAADWSKWPNDIGVSRG
jgi:hypothetical protein